MKTRTLFRRFLAGTLLLAGFAPTPCFAAQDLSSTLEDTFQKQQWSETVQIAAEMLRQNPNSAKARLRGSFALIQRGYPNAALHWLKRMSPEDWKSIPPDMKQLVEIVALFQKKVPMITLPARMDQLNEAESSPFLQDEIRFAKGRSRYEKGDLEGAKAILAQVGTGSRFFGPAAYLLGTISVKKGDLPSATTYFSQTFNPQILQQSSEFWQDMGAQTTHHWGTSLNVALDANALGRASEVGELAVIAIARVLYNQRDFTGALTQYAKIPRTSRLFSRARLETVWSLLQLDRHQDAAMAAADLSTDEKHFESLEALPVRALILTDSGHPIEGRAEIQKFLQIYTKSKESLIRYRQFSSTEMLPDYIKGDLKDDQRIDSVEQYQSALKAEIAALRTEDRMIYPAYLVLAGELEPLLTQCRNYSVGLIIEHVDHRIKELDRLYVQGQLIVAETFLEEREQLRAEFRGKGVNEKEQDEHDRKLVKLLIQAIKEVDVAREAMKTRNLSLEFRQSELLWELSSASAFLSKDEEGTTGKEAYENYRNRAITIAKDLVETQPTFSKRPQAMFFIGFALMEVAQEKQGLEYLRRYVKEYPTHENVPNAYRILADIEFEANRFAQAEELYKQILKFPASPIIGYALYKIGWCSYGMKNHAKALLGLEQAILWTKSMENTDHLLNLKREAGRDLISIYSEVGNHRRAYEYFERFLGAEDATKWLANLAIEIERNGLFEKSNELYTQLLTLNPTPEDRLQYQTSIIHGGYQLRDWKLVLERTKELVDAYEVVLRPEQGTDTPAYKAQKILNEIVLAQHFEFDQYATKDDIARILSIDELYLKAFGKWSDSQMPQYQYAHFLMKYKKVREAAVAFMNHWEQFKTTLKEPIREESLRNVVHALETADEEKDSDPAITAARVDQIVLYTGEYAKSYATTKHARPISFLRTVTLFKHERNEEGIVDTQKVFDEGFSDEFGNRAFKNLRVVYYKLKDWKRTFDWASQMLQKKGIEKTPYLADLKTVREESLFLWADGTEDNLKAAELYLQIAEDSQMQRLRPKALYNAFLQYKQADKRPLALAVAIRLEQTAPNAPELPGIAGVRAAYYQEAGDYEKALPLYERYLKTPPKETPAEALTQARLNTALIAENLGKPAVAAQFYQMVAASAASDPDSVLLAEAKRGLDRIAEGAKRRPASIAPGSFKKWEPLVAKMQELEKMPLAKAEGLAAKIQGGAAKLEKVIRAFLEVSGDPTTPPFFAYESYCAVPFLYTYYQKGIRSLGDGQPEELKVELEKLASPLDTKSLELANQCVSRTTEAFHDGPMYRKVLAKWGWMNNPAAITHADKIRMALGSGAPWLDPASIDMKEDAILKAHLEEQSTPDTWFTLARLRMNENKMGLAKLTFLAALQKTPDSARILNSLAVMRQMDRADLPTLDAAFRKAGEAGSGLAYANLALIHLNGARIALAVDALDKAKSADVFKDQTEILSAIDGLNDALESPPVNDAASPGGAP